jgi:hypothetical protein
MHVITVQVAGGPKQYWAIDGTSGGYPYWSSHLGSAQFFSDFDSAKDVLDNDLDMTRRMEFTDTSSGPPRMIWNGLGLCNTKRKGTGVFTVEEVILNMKFSKTITDQLTGS